MKQTRLAGLEGTNPLGFLAALGVQVAFSTDDKQPRLSWSTDITPRAMVDARFTVDRIADRAMDKLARWKESAAANPQGPDGSKLTKSDELKLKPNDIRTYLQIAVQSEFGGALAPALVAEGSLDKQGVAKPSDLYFTAGQQKFLALARQIMAGVSKGDLVTGMEGPWSYNSKLPSLGWDVADDRVYALRANNPSPEQKLTNPGPEALAILGLTLHPVFASLDKTLTQRCSGSWKAGHYSWPLWHKPASLAVVKSLLAHADLQSDSPKNDRSRWFRSWGVFAIYRSAIRRSSQGGYGTFGPPEIVWQLA